MTAFAYVDASGLPTGGGMKPTVPNGATLLPAPWTVFDLPRLRWDGTAWVERPHLTIVQTASGFAVPEAAPGLSVSGIDRGTGQAVALTVVGAGPTTVALPVDCDLVVTVGADLPWLSVERRIVRGAGSALVKAAAVARARAAARTRFYDAVGRARLAFVTDIPGQQNIYAAKETEARSYLAATPAPATLVAYPLIAAEVGITAPDAYQLAQVWANMAALWKQVAAATERLRMEMSAALDAATSEAEIDAATSAYEAALATLFTP
jgi:hypothetical protein